jgi:site-specific DNA-methyltransferase (adenine-specific)
MPIGGLQGHSDSGSAARFFYCAKASKRDRDEGLDAFAIRSAGEVTGGREDGSAGLQSPRAGAGRTNGARNVHPTVKPTDLMRYLCRLVTPPGGVVLDPFMGSGSTGKGAVLEGFRFIGIEREAEYMEIARARIEAVTSTTDTPAEAEPPHDAYQLPLF